MKEHKDRQPLIKEELVSGNEHILFSQPSALYKLSNIPNKEYSLYLSAFNEKPDTISRLMFELGFVNPNDIINIYINSDGGLVNEGKTLINSLEQTGSRIITTLSSRGYSMGSMLFCLGEKRIVYEQSAIMFHNYSAGSYGKGHELKDHVNFMNSSNEAFFKAYSIGLSDKEIQQIFDGKEFFFNTKEMCQRKIATHVNIEGSLIPAKKYLSLLKKTKKMAAKHKVKITGLLEALKYDIDEVSEYLLAVAVEQDNIKSQIYELMERLN